MTGAIYDLHSSTSLINDGSERIRDQPFLIHSSGIAQKLWTNILLSSDQFIFVFENRQRTCQLLESTTIVNTAYSITFKYNSNEIHFVIKQWRPTIATNSPPLTNQFAKNYNYLNDWFNPQTITYKGPYFTKLYR